MSKSLGNSPDLLELIDKYGADAVRFGIMISSPAGNDLLFDEASLEQGRNFNNKLWNALKLVKMWAERTGNDNITEEIDDSWRLTDETKIQNGEIDELADTEKSWSHNIAVDWFENRLNEVRAEVEIMYAQFKLSEALKTIYSLIWDDFCSWYLEWIKPGFEQPIDEDCTKKRFGFLKNCCKYFIRSCRSLPKRYTIFYQTEPMTCVCASLIPFNLPTKKYCRWGKR